MAQAANGASQYVGLLSQVPFLNQVPHDDLAVLADNSVVRHYEPGQHVVEQGQFGHSMFVLVDGSLAVEATGEDGTHLALGEISRPGDFFGEVALLGRGVRTATVSGRSHSTLLEIEKNRFDRLARRYQIMVDELEKFYHARSISTYTRLHRYLGLLDGAAIEALIAGATMQKFSRDQTVCRAGDPSDTVMLVKDGVLKMVRRGPSGSTSILSYFNTHDVCGAHDGYGGRPAELVALGQCEIIFLRRKAFDALEHSHPDIYSRFGKDDMHRSQALAGAGKTVIGSAQAFLQEGVEVESLLVINLDRCVRCGNCVRACHSRHEFTRLERRGPIFRRRVSIDSHQHEHLLLPSSCRHCRDPECMVGCPTGAIHRNREGEVDINDNCIGCDNCARKCPYGNITMRPLPEHQQKDGVVKRAIKCNLCKGYAYSNCVYNCPRGAVLRVDPLKYFDELALVMEAEQVDAINWARAQAAGALGDKKQRINPRSTKFISYSFVFFALAAVAILAGFFISPAPRSGGTTWGLGFGIIGTGCIGFAMFLGARKRMRGVALGGMEVWTQFHMVVGVLGFIAVLAHAGFRITGVFTTLLLLVFAVEILSGFAGQAIYMTVPRLLTRLERSGLARLIEDLLQEELELSNGIDELSRKLPPELLSFVKGPLDQAAGSISDRYRNSYDPEQQPDLVRRRIDPELRKIAAAHRPTVDRILKDVIRLKDVRAQIRLHATLKAWLVVHLASSAALGTLLLAHIVFMLMIM
jgi:Fe-S-cluster-containing dehydrogenase component